MLRGVSNIDAGATAVIGGSVTGGTAGSVLFVGAGSVLAQDNTNLFWDDANDRLGIGTNSPQAGLHLGSGKSILLGNNTNLYFYDTATVARSILRMDSSDNVYLSGRSGVTDFYLGFSNNLVLKSAGTSLGIGTATVDSASITISSAVSNGTTLYNTADQTTNYERIRSAYTSNEYWILSQKGGTGIARDIGIGYGTAGQTGGAFKVQSDALPYSQVWVPVSSSTSTTGHFNIGIGSSGGTGLNASSGTQYFAAISSGWNQTGTAGGVDWYINRTNTSIGSGVQSYLRLATSGTIAYDFKAGGPRRYVPSATQTLSAGTATLANAAIVKVQGNGAATTITAAPSIADGEEGDIIIIQGQSSTNTVTYQDQGTLASSNLRLGATTRVLGARDSLVLEFDGTEWVEISYSNVL